LIIVGAFAIILKNKLKVKNSIYHLLVFGAISAIPVMVWMYRNYALTGFLMGGSKPSSTVGLFADINSILVAIFNDFFYKVLPQQLNSMFLYIVIMAIVAVALILKPSREYFKKNSVIIAYIFVYLLSVIVARQVWSHDTMGTRQTAPIYPYLLLFVISLIHYGYNRIEKPKVKQVIYRAVIAVFAIFMIVQMSSSLLFYVSARHGQGYSSPSWRNEQGINWLQNNVCGNPVIYSDVAEGVGFLIKKPTQYLPSTEDSQAVDEFMGEMPDNAYVICFKEVYHRPYLMSNSEIKEANQRYKELVMVADYPTSTIWRHE
jgi:hypothetical protein